jgi:hypothetical protein
VESFEHPEDAFPAQAGENPAFYHLPYWHHVLGVDSSRLHGPAEPYAFVKVASFDGVQIKLFQILKSYATQSLGLSCKQLGSIYSDLWCRFLR